MFVGVTVPSHGNEVDGVQQAYSQVAILLINFGEKATHEKLFEMVLSIPYESSIKGLNVRRRVGRHKHKLHILERHSLRVSGAVVKK